MSGQIPPNNSYPSYPMPPGTPQHKRGTRRRFTQMNSEDNASKATGQSNTSKVATPLFNRGKGFALSAVPPGESPPKKMRLGGGVEFLRGRLPRFNESDLTKASDNESDLTEASDNESNLTETSDGEEVLPPSFADVEKELFPEKDTKREPATFFEKLSMDASENKWFFGTHEVAIFSLAQGSFMSVYNLGETSAQIAPEMSNESLVLKIFKERHATKQERVLQKYMSNALESYKLAQELGFNVATIFNKTTATQDGFYIQEKIPFQFDIRNPKHIQQVREYLLKALKQDALVDLHAGNFCARENQEIVLIDFFEETVIPDGQEETEIDKLTKTSETRLTLINHAVKSYASLFREHCNQKEKVSEFLNFFTEGFEEYGYKKENNTAILDDFFFEIKIRPLKVPAKDSQV